LKIQFPRKGKKGTFASGEKGQTKRVKNEDAKGGPETTAESNARKKRTPKGLSIPEERFDRPAETDATRPTRKRMSTVQGRLGV